MFFNRQMWQLFWHRKKLHAVSHSMAASFIYNVMECRIAVRCPSASASHEYTASRGGQDMSRLSGQKYTGKFCNRGISNIPAYSVSAMDRFSVRQITNGTGYPSECLCSQMRSILSFARLVFTQFPYSLQERAKSQICSFPSKTGCVARQQRMASMVKGVEPILVPFRYCSEATQVL